MHTNIVTRTGFEGISPSRTVGFAPQATEARYADAQAALEKIAPSGWVKDKVKQSLFGRKTTLSITAVGESALTQIHQQLASYSQRRAVSFAWREKMQRKAGGGLEMVVEVTMPTNKLSAFCADVAERSLSIAGDSASVKSKAKALAGYQCAPNELLAHSMSDAAEMAARLVDAGIAFRRKEAPQSLFGKITSVFARRKSMLLFELMDMDRPEGLQARVNQENVKDVASGLKAAQDAAYVAEQAEWRAMALKRQEILAAKAKHEEELCLKAAASFKEDSKPSPTPTSPFVSATAIQNLATGIFAELQATADALPANQRPAAPVQFASQIKFSAGRWAVAGRLNERAA